MTDHQNQCLKNGYHLVKISNGKNSKKFTTRINGYYFDFFFFRPNLSLCLNLKITIAPAIRTIATAS